MKTRLHLLAGAAALVFASAPALSANIVLNNVDPPGIGFNDTTPAAPVGGNAGTTVGAQRLIAYQRALELWGKTLKSKVTIVVQGSFDSLSCDATGGTLAAAGALQIFSDFPGAPLAGHWYHAALANAIAGEDLTPGPPDPGPLAPPYNDDIIAYFNGDVGKPGCIEGPGWYYGLDNNAPAGQIDFLDTFMHEVGHGLGFQNFADLETGDLIEGLPDVYMANTADLTLRKRWNQLDAAQIVASSVNTNNVVWVGPKVTANSKLVLGPYEGIKLTGSLSGELLIGLASIGSAPSAANFGGPVTLVNDGTGVTSDGCEPIAANLSGQVALIDRGTCTFNVKALNAQNAGAKAVVIANTLGRGVFEPGGDDPSVTVPVIGISNADGDRIKAALPNVGVAYFVDKKRRAGTSEGFVRLYSPPTLSTGSSISHFDTSASPNLLMEPFINDDLRSTRNLDLTPSLMQDIGWALESVKIGRCDTGIPNALANGDLLGVQVEACAANAKRPGQFVSCVADLAQRADKLDLIRPLQKVALIACSVLGQIGKH